jgi:hypothetical protein
VVIMAAAALPLWSCCPFQSWYALLPDASLPAGNRAPQAAADRLDQA